MGRTWRIPNSGVQVDVGPSLEPPSAHWRFPVVEQLATQFGGAFAQDSRPLSSHELEIARPVFRESIEYSSVRVVRAHFANAPTTLGNHIRIGFDSRFDDATVLHELTHIWQYQTRGTGYISNSLCAQVVGAIATGSRNAAYEVLPAQLSQVRSFYDLSAERQARVVEFYFVSRLLRDADRSQRERARREFWYLVQDFTDPATDRAQFDAECAELDRMIATVRRARPISVIEIYQESLHGPGANRSFFDGIDSHAEPHIMPFFRIEF